MTAQKSSENTTEVMQKKDLVHSAALSQAQASNKQVIGGKSVCKGKNNMAVKN